MRWETLQHEPVFAEIAEEFICFISGAELIIYDAPFDVGFVDAEFRRLGRRGVMDICTVTDSREMALALHPDQPATLDALCMRYNVDTAGWSTYGGMRTVELLADVYLAMTRQ